MLRFLDEKYPKHAHHTLLDWRAMTDRGPLTIWAMRCDCGAELEFTAVEAVYEVEMVPLH